MCTGAFPQTLQLFYLLSFSICVKILTIPDNQLWTSIFLIVSVRQGMGKVGNVVCHEIAVKLLNTGGEILNKYRHHEQYWLILFAVIGHPQIEYLNLETTRKQCVKSVFLNENCYIYLSLVEMQVHFYILKLDTSLNITLNIERALLLFFFLLKKLLYQVRLQFSNVFSYTCRCCTKGPKHKQTINKERKTKIRTRLQP